MPRFVLVISDRPIAVFDAPNWHRANALTRSSDLAATLRDTKSGGVALWDGESQLNFRIAKSFEEARWQKQHRANVAKFGDDDQGLFLWLAPLDYGHAWFHMKDDWGLW